MNLLEKTYNTAIRFLQEEKLEEAKELLEEILRKEPDNLDVKWAAGLTEVLLGYPHKAREIWSGLDNIDQHQKIVEEKIPIYEKIFAQYNEAIELLENDDPKSLTLLKDLITHHSNVPLPVECYKGYLLALISFSEEEQVETAFRHLPKYIKESNNIIALQNMYHLHINHERTNIKPNKWLKNSIYIAGLAASIFIGAFLMNLYQGKDIEEVANPLPVVAEVDDHLLIELETIQGNVTKLEKEKLELTQELTQTQAEREELARKQEVLNDPTVAGQVGLLIYQKGYSAYKNGDEESAVKLFEQSLAAQPIGYYSDDATFYSIQAMKNVQQDTRLAIEGFLENNSEHFKESPFYDDVLLLKAESQIQSSEISEAKETLERVIQEYPEEWTASRAASILKDIEEGSNDGTN